MSWVKLDDAILDNPKIVAAGPIGLLLHVAAITWCGRNLTDGLIPKRKVCSLVHLGGIGTAIAAPPACGPEEDTFSQIDADEVADELAKIGLWHDRGFYWEIHDYLVYNPSREKVLADRERARTKKAQQRMSPDVSPGDNHGDMHGSPDPVPVYPVPVPVPVPQKILSLASQARPCAATPEDLVGIWNAHRGTLPKAIALSAKRRTHAKARLLERSLADWTLIVERCAATPFCRGERGSGWAATFDWLIESPDNALKVLEGKYDTRTPLSAQEAREADARTRVMERLAKEGL